MQSSSCFDLYRSFIDRHGERSEENINNDIDIDIEQMINVNISNVSEKIKLQTLKQLIELFNDFEDYCEEILVLGFNSSKYDLNLVKSKLAKYLHLHQSEKQLRGHLQLKGTMRICVFQMESLNFF